VRGRAARARAPRRSHAGYTPAPGRADPIAILESQSAVRLPELVPLRYGRMCESPFRFYRGAAAIMAADLAGSPTSGIDVQLCGDAHLLNFRLLASPERHLVFDLNDFDETLPGPWEWDLKRLAASLVIAGRANGFGPSGCRAAVRAAAEAYREWMRRFAVMGNLDVWYAHADVDDLLAAHAAALPRRYTRQITRAARGARDRDRTRAFSRLTETGPGGQVRFRSQPPLLLPLRDLVDASAAARLRDALATILGSYGDTLAEDRRALLGQYRLVDVARKVVGVGSVGTRCSVALLVGRDDDDPLLLQVKEAGPSVLAAHLTPRHQDDGGRHDNQGQRVVAGQRMMQAVGDILLGWQRLRGVDGQVRDFYVRQLADWKGIAVPERMDAGGLALFARLCGATLARAHARSGDRIAIAAYLGRGDTFTEAIAGFAEAYADQNARDHAALVAAARSGRITAATAAGGAHSPR